MQDKKKNSILNNVDKQKGLTPILVVILIAVAVGGYLMYAKSQTKSTQQTIKPSPAPTNEVANWKTYTDNTYKFSLQYPQDSKLILNPDKNTIIELIPPYADELSKSELTISVIDKTGEEQIGNLITKDLNTYKNNLFSGVLPVTIDLFQAKKFYTNQCQEFYSNCQKLANYYLSISTYVFVIKSKNFTDPDFNLTRSGETLEKIVSTIKFIR